ncbi:hypothetical protein M758_UG015300 [Ceratodon purpureus]|nr:hypothetical protein M758_UG015300 [Ceratodon purpureus]
MHIATYDVRSLTLSAAVASWLGHSRRVCTTLEAYAGHVSQPRQPKHCFRAPSVATLHSLMTFPIPLSLSAPPVLPPLNPNSSTRAPNVYSLPTYFYAVQADCPACTRAPP